MLGLLAPNLPVFAEQNATPAPTGTHQPTEAKPTPTTATTPTTGVTATANTDPVPAITPTPVISTPTSTTTVPVTTDQPTTGSATPTPPATSTPTPEQLQQQETQAALKAEILTKAGTYLLNIGQPAPEAIDAWLAACHSPQLQEATPGKTEGQLYVELGWKYGINPAYALAFFTKESTCGTAGNNLDAHNFGNIRWTPGNPTLDNVWRSYPSWNAGMEDWFKLIKEQYMQGGLKDLGKILPVYAPEVENDTTLYIKQVMDWVDIIMTSAPAPKLDLSASWKEPTTAFLIGWNFLTYWRSHGGEATIGKPWGNQQYENGRIVQYFDHGVLEYHPENKPADQVVFRPATLPAPTSTPVPNESFSRTLNWLAAWISDYWKNKDSYNYRYAMPLKLSLTYQQPNS